MACWRPDNNITQIEEEFVNFYCRVIVQMFKSKSGANKNWLPKCKEALKIITQHESNMNYEAIKRYYSYINFRESAIRFAYVYAFSIINTCTAYQHFLKYFNENENLKRIVATKKNIRICCLGGGPGVEAVAICKIINDYFKEIFSKSYTETASDNRTSQVTVHVTIVDIFIHWGHEAFPIMEAMIESTIVDSERVKIEYSFIQADLLQRIKRNLEEELKKADIVTMVSIGNEIIVKEAENLSPLCENLCRIVELLKVDSCLFIQESAEGQPFCRLRKSVYSTSITNIESYEGCVYSLQQATLKQFNSSVLKNLLRYKPYPVSTSKTSSCICVQTKPTRTEIPKK